MGDQPIIANQIASLPSIPPWRAGWSVVMWVVLQVARTTQATAFPLIDPLNQTDVPNGTELATQDAQDLRHQRQLASGLEAPADRGWTFLPRLELQELLTDNALQQHAPRRWDFATYVSPGIAVAANVPRLQLTFDYAPTLAVYARTTSLNALTQQFNGTGLITVAPELAYVDVRALAGVHDRYGGIGGLGTIGSSAAAADVSQATIPSLAGNSFGLQRDSEVQTASYGISPYLLRRFGDYGTGKLGYSVDVTTSDVLNGLVASPLPSGGASSQTVVTQEQIAHFATGEILGVVQNSFDVDLQQSHTTSDAGYPTGTIGVPAGNTTVSSTRQFIANQVSYALNRSATVFASGGHEDIHYSGLNNQSINDLTWSLGITLTSDRDSVLTVSYGHLNGFNSFSANGRYSLTARTILTLSYASTLGTQAEDLQRQLNLATVNGSGSLVNAQTGGTLFGSTNALRVQEGLLRTDSLVVGSRTGLDRDVVRADLFFTKQSQVGGFGSSATSSKAASLQWTHEVRPDLTLTSTIAYSLQDEGAAAVFNPGREPIGGRKRCTAAANFRYT